MLFRSGFLTKRFGDGRVVIAGTFFALVSMLALVWQALHGLNEFALAIILFVRGIGLGAVGLPTISLAYAAVEPAVLPMATTTLNIVQRIGGPTLSTLSVLFLTWALQGHASYFGLNAWSEAFLLFAALHAIMTLAAVTLHRSSNRRIL